MALPPPPPGLNLADNAQAGVYAACCVCFPVAIVTLILRFVARRLTKAQLWWDDWFVVMAMVGDIGFFISTMILLQNGMGKHYETDTMVQYTNFAKTYIPAACFYAVGIAMTKMSLLFFYRRIFSAVDSLRPFMWILSFLILGWMFAVIFVSIFSCTPVAFWWDKTIPDGHCVNNTAFLLGNSIPNICTDFFILTLPMPYIWKLNQSLGRKLVVSCLFLLGGFVCIITIVRLVIQLHTDFTSLDLTWAITDFVTWTNVEVSLAIVSACLPSLRPVVNWVMNGGRMPDPSTTHAKSVNSSHNSSRLNWTGRNTPRGANVLETMSSYKGDPMPAYGRNAIRMDRDVTVSRSPGYPPMREEDLYPLTDNHNMVTTVGTAH